MKPVYYIFLFLSILVFTPVDAQINFSQKKHNFGDIEKDSQRWVDIQVANNGDKEVKIIKVTNPDNEFEYKFSSMVIPPNESSDIRIQFNPLEKGKQSIDLTFFFDRETVDFKISANVLHISRSYTPCPDFDNPSRGPKTFETTFKVFDKITKKPISKAEIHLNSNMEPLEYATNRNGIVQAVVPLSYYVMEIDAKGYFGQDSAGYINKRNHEFSFYLTPIKVEEAEDDIVLEQDVKVEDSEDMSDKEDDEIAPVTKEIVNDNNHQDVPNETVVEELNEEQIIEENEEFSSKEYAPNNIVFLMDVSTSMKKEDRLVMLKESLKSLTDMMRSDDIISLITYASTTDILIEGQPMNNKASIKEIISNIDGKGTTAGGKGIKKAYALAAKYNIDGGNNHVYIATDGAFNKNDEQLIKTVARQAKKGYKLSVLSLNSSDFAKTKMMELSESGQGDFVNIEEMQDITTVLQSMIKKQSKIR